MIDFLHFNSRIAEQICHGGYEQVMEDSDSDSDESSPNASMRGTAVAEWLENTRGSAETTCDETATDEDREEELISGHKTLIESEAYRWLVSVMQRISDLNGVHPHAMSRSREIMAQQLQALMTQEAHKQKSRRLITSKKQPPLYMVRFDLLWDPLTVLREECGDENPELIGQAVTLTGDGRFVQAETRRDYLERVWPTTGSEFMDLVEDLVTSSRTRAGQSCICKLLVLRFQTFRKTDCAKDVLPDRTQISARQDGKICIIEALGTQCGLSDVAEQLLWISATLIKPSGPATAMTLCSAELLPTTTPDHGNAHLDMKYQPRCLGKVAFRVAHTTNPLQEVSPGEGDCWMQLFRSHPVVVGYPIPSRKPQRPGLELSLDIMASLIGADRVTLFGQDMVMKGYCDLFYATEHHDHFIMWHLLCNKSETPSEMSRISFADKRIPRPTDQRLSLLRPGDALCMRHIVGWTNTVRSNAGQSVAQIA